MKWKLGFLHDLFTSETHVLKEIPHPATLVKIQVFCTNAILSQTHESGVKNIILYFLNLIRQHRNDAVRSPSFHHMCFGIDFHVLLQTCVGLDFLVTMHMEHFSKQLPATQFIVPVKRNLGKSFLCFREPKTSRVWPVLVGFFPREGWWGLETSPGHQPLTWAAALPEQIRAHTNFSFPYGKRFSFVCQSLQSSWLSGVVPLDFKAYQLGLFMQL